MTKNMHMADCRERRKQILCNLRLTLMCCLQLLPHKRTWQLFSLLHLLFLLSAVCITMFENYIKMPLQCLIFVKKKPLTYVMLIFGIKIQKIYLNIYDARHVAKWDIAVWYVTRKEGDKAVSWIGHRFLSHIRWFGMMSVIPTATEQQGKTLREEDGCSYVGRDRGSSR